MMRGFAGSTVSALADTRKVVSDPEARYYGSRVEERSLVPLGEARLGYIGFEEWFRGSGLIAHLSNGGWASMSIL